ncbi:MAG TPA: ActS/PrrB/RegB family redox-sensitive histidine kinase [Xanthobacteraceae bacterium]|jgi:two-component system sensor histidine kinase RegB
MPSDRIGRSVRLDTLVRLRWLAVIGQATAVLVVYWGLDFDLPVWACLSMIALAAWLNIAMGARFPLRQRLEPERAGWLLAFDATELAVLLFFTGGLQNPFSLLLLGPVLISAAALPPRLTLLLGAFAIACATVLMFLHYPLPWDSEPPLELPPVYVTGIWFSILLAIAFIGLHAWQVTEESRQLADALAATELVLAREQHLSQLDGLAAAAAHELGTPLATITLIAKELLLAVKPGSEHADDVRLLSEQARRCRAILGKLTELSTGDPFDRMNLSTLIEEVVAPHRHFGIAIKVAIGAGEPPEPAGGRNPAVLYGLGNLIENAVDFARGEVDVSTSWSEQTVSVMIADDGPGFAPEIMDRIGEPYVTTQRQKRPNMGSAQSEVASGLGLGCFIAKTLLERSGANVEFENRALPAHGATVRVQWARQDFESMAAFPK